MSIVAVAERGLCAAGSRGLHKISGNVIVSCLRHRRGQADGICITRYLRDIGAIVGRWVVSRYRGVIDAADIRVELEAIRSRSEEHTSELQSQSNLVCRLLLEKKKIYR